MIEIFEKGSKCYFLESSSGQLKDFCGFEKIAILDWADNKAIGVFS